MARTKRQKSPVKTPRKKKQTFKRAENTAGGFISRRRSKGRKLANALLSEMERNSSNKSHVQSPKQCFYFDTTPSTVETLNVQNAESMVNKLNHRNRQKIAFEQTGASTSFNLSKDTLVPAANSTKLATPITFTGEIIDVSPEKTDTPARRKRDSKRGQSTAEKVRQKWRKYTKERLKKANLLAVTGVSPNSRRAETKATILSLLGDKSNDVDEFNVTIENDANLLQDLDLVILAASPDDYESYTKLLRQEYASMNDENYKQMRLKKRERTLKRNLNQSADFNFSKFREELAKNELILNSTACLAKRSPKKTKIAANNTATSRTIEDGEIVTDLDETLRKVNKTKENVKEHATDNDDDDCILVEKTVEQIVIDDDTTPNIEEVDDNKTKENIFFKDTTGTPTLKFTPQQRKERSTPVSNRRSCTAVLNSSDVIILDETCCSSTNASRAHNSLDDSIMFVSESAPNFIPLVSENVPKPLHVVRNPFSPKIKNSKQPSSNDTLFSKSEKKALENYNFNTYNPQAPEEKKAVKKTSKRMIIIDGSNVAYSHSLQREFSVKGLEICIEYFKKMGHEVKAVVPQMRLKYRNSTDPATLDKLYKEGTVVLTPCKSIPGNHQSSSYDDRFILQLASETGGVIVSNDNYRDLVNENAAFKKLILSRVVGYTWVNDMFMLPKDPYGKNGPTLHSILNRNPKKQ